MELVLRPMKAADVTVGKKVFCFGDFDCIYKGKVAEVIKPNCPYKAFTADDGSRYGLEDMYVKAEKDFNPLED